MKIILRAPTDSVLIVDHTRGGLRYRGSPVVVDGAALKANRGAKILTDEPERVCLLLGIPFPDPQVVNCRRVQ